MLAREERKFRRNRTLGLNVMEAHYVEFAYPRHSHDHYVIGLIEHGVQSFSFKGTKLYTPASGLILLNPSVVHTGEAAVEQGFYLRSFYPTVEHLERVAFEMTGRSQTIPYFCQPRVDNPLLARQLLSLHEAAMNGAEPLVIESWFKLTMARLIEGYADLRLAPYLLGDERKTVRKARQYLEENYAETIQLDDLARHVALSPYHLLRIFQRDVGLPPHAYLQDIRVREALRRIEQGEPLVDVAHSVGFSSQSHMNRRFKQIVGLTPGQYAHQIHAV